jgi:predicted ArsR family transcriptional regulator
MYKFFCFQDTDVQIIWMDRKGKQVGWRIIRFTGNQSGSISQLIQRYLKEHGEATNPEMAEALELTGSSVSSLTYRLYLKGVLERDGNVKKFRYRLKENA